MFFFRWAKQSDSSSDDGDDSPVTSPVRENSLQHDHNHQHQSCEKAGIGAPTVENGGNLKPGVEAPAVCDDGKKKSMAQIVNPAEIAANMVRETKVLKKVKTSSGAKKINQYVLMKKLGSGSFGEVKLCRDSKTSELYAMKVVKKRIRHENNAIAEEIAIMKKLAHPNIVGLIEVIDDPSARHVYLVLEFVQLGALMPESVNAVPFTLSTARKYFRDILSGLECLHVNRIAHRDLKPSNFLLSENDTVKIADFGLSHVFGDHHEVSATTSNGVNDLPLLSPTTSTRRDSSQKKILGTPAFMSPELWTFDKADDADALDVFAADMWALGCSLFMLAFGHLPFMGDSILDLEKKVVNQAVTIGQVPQVCLNQGGDGGIKVDQNNKEIKVGSLPPSAILEADGDLRHLLTGMLRKDPRTRMKLNDVFQDAWVKKGPGDHAKRYTDGRLSVSEGEKARAVSSLNTLAMVLNIKRRMSTCIKITRSNLEQKRRSSDAMEITEPNVARSVNSLTDPKFIANSSVADNRPAQVVSAGVNPGHATAAANVRNTSVQFVGDKTGLQRGVTPPGRVSTSAETDLLLKSSKSLHRCDRGRKASITTSTLDLRLAASMCVEDGDSDSDSDASNFAEDSCTQISGDNFDDYLISTDSPAVNDIESMTDQDDMLPLEALTGKIHIWSQETHMGLVAGVASDDGGVGYQEDRVFTQFLSLSEVPSEVMDAGGCFLNPAFSSCTPSSWSERSDFALLFGVFDGHSGSECVDFIQDYLPWNIQNQLRALPKPLQNNSVECAIKKAFAATDQAFLDIAEKNMHFSGSTALVVLIFDDGTMCTANLGDCRAVATVDSVQRHKVTQDDPTHSMGKPKWDTFELTTDCTPKLEDERVRIEASGGWIANGRVNGVLAVSRSFGDIEYKNLKEISWDKQFSSDIVICEPQVTTLHCFILIFFLEIDLTFLIYFPQFTVGSICE
jgi:[calcium/calmodulin-dependent protein kinase] kinase